MSKVISSLTQVIMFAITVAYSIYTTVKKAIQLINKEKKQAAEKDSGEPLIGKLDMENTKNEEVAELIEA